MKNRFGGGLAACAMASVFMLGMSAAHATSGRISFSGAVVEPTCSTVDIQAVTVAANTSRTLSCGATATDPGRAYSRMVTTLDSTAIGNDELLAHLASYTGNAGLVVNTYL